MKYMWWPIIELLEFLLNESNNNDHIIQALKGIETLIGISGSLGLRSAMERILQNLCAWKIDIDLRAITYEVGYNNICVCKTVAKIAQCSYSLLMQKDWMFILQFLEKINEAFYKNKAEIGKMQMELMQFNVLNKKVENDIEKYLTKTVQNNNLKNDEKERNNKSEESKTDSSNPIKDEVGKPEVLKDEIEKLTSVLDSLFVLTSTFSVILL